MDGCVCAGRHDKTSVGGNVKTKYELAKVQYKPKMRVETVVLHVHKVLCWSVHEYIHAPIKKVCCPL